MISWLLLVLGLTVLVFAGDFLVKGAVGLAIKFNISTLVIGMTVVSFGTSAPELIVSLNAAIDGHPDIAIGNVIGSNIANIALVLGVTTLIFPIIVDKNSLKVDWPFMFLASLLFYWFAHDGLIEWYEGAILFSLLILFTLFIIVKSRRENVKTDLDSQEEIEHAKDSALWKSLSFLGFGMIGLYFGAEWLLKGAVQIAKDFGLEERIIGVTVVAFGTSVPELAASAMAAIRKETDISIGNLIGSNIFNIMAVIGITAMVHPIGVNQNSIDFDMLWMLAIAFVLLPLMLSKKFNRWKGALLFTTYLVYTIVLVSLI